MNGSDFCEWYSTLRTSVKGVAIGNLGISQIQTAMNTGADSTALFYISPELYPQMDKSKNLENKH